MSRGAGAIAAAALVVGGYALWRKWRDGGENYAVYRVDYQTGGKSADLGGGLLAWGLDTLVGALGQGGASSAASAGATRASGGAWALLDLIGRAEAPGGYNAVYAGSKITPPRPITSMTVGEVLAWQDESVRAGSASSAAGRYQVLRGTLREAVAAGVVSEGELYGPEQQDAVALHLADRRGLSDYQAGKITPERFANNLAREWAGLPVATGSKAGRSYYDGDGLNAARVSVDAVLAALKGI